MMVEITEVTIAEDKISIVATNLDNILLADNLYEDIDPKPVQFEFDRHAKGGREMKYLYKVCQGQSKCRSAKSMGEKIEKLCGVITTLSESFQVRE
ncbi:MAG: hypothetical protein IKF09_02630 [Clostridiales bacterium]|nr:hypothetical protein [Clostridiales bacterium]